MTNSLWRMCYFIFKRNAKQRLKPTACFSAYFQLSKGVTSSKKYKDQAFVVPPGAKATLLVLKCFQPGFFHPC